MRLRPLRPRFVASHEPGNAIHHGSTRQRSASMTASASRLATRQKSHCRLPGLGGAGRKSRPRRSQNGSTLPRRCGRLTSRQIRSGEGWLYRRSGAKSSAAGSSAGGWRLHAPRARRRRAEEWRSRRAGAPRERFIIPITVGQLSGLTFRRTCHTSGQQSIAAVGSFLRQRRCGDSLRAPDRGDIAARRARGRLTVPRRAARGEPRVHRGFYNASSR